MSSQSILGNIRLRVREFLTDSSFPRTRGVTMDGHVFEERGKRESIPLIPPSSRLRGSDRQPAVHGYLGNRRWPRRRIPIRAVAALSLLLLTSTAAFAGGPHRLPSGTLTYKIIFTGHATTRSSAQNAASGGRLLRLISRPVPNTVTIHQVVTGTVHMNGWSSLTDPLASRAERNAQSTQNEHVMHKATQPEQSFAAKIMKAQAACHGNMACIMAANKRVTSHMSPQAKAALNTAQPASKIRGARNRVSTRFRNSRSSGACHRKVVVANKAQGVSITGGGGYDAAMTYAVNMSHTTHLGCKPPGVTYDSPNAHKTTLAYDSWHKTYEMRLAAITFTASAPYKFKTAISNPAHKVSQGSGTDKVTYTVSVPMILLKGLHAAAPTHATGGTATVKVHYAIGTHYTPDPTFGTFSGPVKAVITWRFTPN